MLGLGETRNEILYMFDELLKAGCELLTLGQYLYPGGDCLPVQSYIHPDIFDQYKDIALKLGFRGVNAGPYVRSSYLAEAMMNEIKGVSCEKSLC